jgi:hypothetical protein
MRIIYAGKMQSVFNIKAVGIYTYHYPLKSLKQPGTVYFGYLFTVAT